MARRVSLCSPAWAQRSNASNIYADARAICCGNREPEQVHQQSCTAPSPPQSCGHGLLPLQVMVEGSALAGSALVKTPSGTPLPRAGELRPPLAHDALTACGTLFLLLGPSCFSKAVGQPLLNVLQKACQYLELMFGAPPCPVLEGGPYTPLL